MVWYQARRELKYEIRIVSCAETEVAQSVPSALRAINEGEVFRYFTKPCDIVELALAIRLGLEEKECSQT